MRLSFPYGDGWAQTGLAELLRQELDQAGVKPPFTVSHAGKGFLDVNSLADAKGSRIIVLTVPPANGKPQDPVREVTIALPAEEVSALSGAWAFRPVARDAHRAVGGVPQALAVEKDGGVARLKLGEVGSAALVLLARDAPPLLGLEARASVEKGSKFTVSATCVNPSPRAVGGVLDLILPAASRALTAPVQIALEPRASRSVTFEVLAPATPQRLTVKARFAPATVGSIRKPVSSTKTRCAPSRAAPF